MKIRRTSREKSDKSWEELGKIAKNENSKNFIDQVIRLLEPFSGKGRGIDGVRMNEWEEVKRILEDRLAVINKKVKKINKKRNVVVLFLRSLIKEEIRISSVGIEGKKG